MSEQEKPITTSDEQAVEQPSTPVKKKRGPVSRFLRWVLILLLSPIVLFLVLTALLYVPFIQDWAVGIACEKLSESTGMDVQVERVRLKFPLDVDLQELCITQPDTIHHQSTNDTVLAVKNCVVDLDMCGILSLNIGVDAFDLQDVVVDTHDMVATMKMRGRMNQFHLDAHDLQLKESRVNITSASLDGCDLDIALQDTTVIDTTTSQPLQWVLNFGNISVHDSRIAFHTANDTMSVRAGIDALCLESGTFDLGHNKLKLQVLDLAADSVLYDMNYQPHGQGLDFNHLALYDVDVALPILDYDLNAGHLHTALTTLKLRERNGFELENLSAGIDLDTTHVHISDAVLKTPSSELRAWADIDWDALTPNNRGSFHAGLSADFSKQDVMHFAGAYMPDYLKSQYPDKTLTAEVELTGNVDHVDVQSMRLIMPGMLDAKVSGSAGNLLNGKELSANLDWDVHTLDLSLVKRLAGLTGFNLPPMDISGSTHFEGNIYEADLAVRQGSGSLALKGKFDAKSYAYQAKIDARNFAVSRFVPMDSACVFTAQADVRGRGFDVLGSNAQLRALLNVPKAHYGRHNIGSVQMDAQLNRGNGVVNFYGYGDYVDADGCLEVQLRNHKVDSAAFNFDVRGLDLYALGLTKKPFKASMAMHVLGNTNLTDQHYFKGDVSAIQLAVQDTMYYPKDINAEALLTPDTTFTFLSAGDLNFYMNSTEGMSTLVHKFTDFAEVAARDMDARDFDQQRLTALLPEADLCVQSGRQNPLTNILYMMTGYSYRELDVDLHTSPETGINGDGHIYSTNTGSIVLDSIAFTLEQDTTGFNLDARVCNGKRNKDVTFDTRLKANLTPGNVGCSLQFFDAKNRKGVDLGAQVRFHHGTIRVHLTPLRPILAYRYFTINEDNYVELSKDRRIDANLDLLADDGTGIKLYSTPNEEAEQDLTATLNHFNLGELTSVMPYMPKITGYLHGDVHLLKSQTVTSVMADLMANRLTYEGCEMGNIGVNAAYMPNDDGSHYVDGFLTQNDVQVLSFNGRYAEKGHSDEIDAQAIFEHFPLTIANGFLDETLRLTGDMDGELQVTGSTSRPRVDGFIRTDSLYILSPLYSINMRVADDSIRVANNKLNLDKLQGYTTGVTPLTMDGTIDFSDFGNILMDVRAKAKNFELINAPKNRKAAAYGKVFVDVDVRAKGSTNDLDVTGNLGVLGNTNMTYVLMDSPITVEDEMSDLVTFCDFSDTVQQAEPTIVPPPSNLNMRLRISIDQAAQVNCLLSPDGSNYIKLEGGGDLTMNYDEAKGLHLYGRYTILTGQMTYTLMVMSLTDCKIANGSYVEFSGDVTNPRLNISASERILCSVTENDQPRSVAFDVGLAITQTLKNMGLAFTLEAPEDMMIQNQLTQMAPEMRGRVAVTLLATGMYIVEGQQSGGFNTTNALNSFLQGQISAITGKVLSNFDISLGVNNMQTASGKMTTDYSFRFAKRFWGNRISVIIGGKVSSGSETQNTGETIIDNVCIEYRLDKSATRYVTVFYGKDNESVLEADVLELGAGLVLRKKTDRLGELFLFRRKKEDNKE